MSEVAAEYLTVHDELSQFSEDIRVFALGVTFSIRNCTLYRVQ